MQLNPPNPLEADAQRALDDLYWNSTCTAKSLAERFGLSSARVPKVITPLPTGIECWWCRRVLTWASRSERSSSRDLICPDCGARTSSRAADQRLRPSDNAIVLTTAGHGTPKDLSVDAGEGVAALATLGLGWSGCFAAVDVRCGPTNVRDAVVALGVEVVVVPSVRALGISQGDAFGAFRLLLRAELRIITARDIVWATSNSGGYYNPCSPRWSEYGRGDQTDFDDDWTSRGRRWADEYRMLGLEDPQDDEEHAG